MKEEKSRVPIPEELAATVLFKSDRTCCVCRNQRLPVQLHHIDEDSSNNIEENLAVLCTVCHDDTQLKGGFGRKLNAALVRHYKTNWEAVIAVGRSATSGQAEKNSSRTGLLRIRAKLTYLFQVGGRAIPLGRHISVDITNVGDDTRFVEMLGVKIDPPDGRSRYAQLQFVGALLNFEKRIGRGEQRSFSVALSDLAQESPLHDGLKEGESFCLFAQDTMGDRHFSDTITYEKE